MREKSKKIIGKLLIVFILIILYSYILAITNLPDELVIFEGESISIRTLLGLNIKTRDEDTIETASNNSQAISKTSGKATLEVSLFDSINLKKVNVDVLPRTTVIPVRKYSRS